MGCVSHSRVAPFFVPFLPLSFVTPPHSPRAPRKPISIASEGSLINNLAMLRRLLLNWTPTRVIGRGQDTAPLPPGFSLFLPFPPLSLSYTSLSPLLSHQTLSLASMRVALPHIMRTRVHHTFLHRPYYLEPPPLPSHHQIRWKCSL